MKRKKIRATSILLIVMLALTYVQSFALADVDQSWNSGVKINFIPASYDFMYDVPDWISNNQTDLDLEAYENLFENNTKWNIFVGPLRVYQNYLKINNMQALSSNGASISKFKDSSTLEPGTPKSEAEILLNLGVLSGVEENDGSYMYMNSYVKRGEVAKIMAVFYQKLFPEFRATRQAYNFEDTQNHWSKPYVDYCYERELLNGKSSTSFDPDGFMTKAESIKLLCNMINIESPILTQNVAKAINETYKCTTAYDDENKSNYSNSDSSSNNIVITPEKWCYTVLPNNTVNIEVECNNKYRKLEFNSINSNVNITKTTSSSGKYIVTVKGVYEGVGFISCNCTTGTSQYETLYIPIFVKSYNAYKASNVTIENSNLSLSVGEQYLLSSDVSVTPNSASYNGIYFSSTDPNIASVNYLTGQIIGRASGTCYINVMTYGITKRVKVKVSGYNYNYNYNNQYISLSVKLGKTINLKQYVPNIGYNTTYHSSNTNIATVNNSGVVTGRKNGVTQILVSSNGNQYIINLIVGSGNYNYNYDYDVKNISLISNSISILKNEEYDMFDNISVYPQNADMSDLKFYSENTSVATVGKKDGMVSGVSKGATRIKIVCDNITRYCTVYVRAKTYEEDEINEVIINLPDNKLYLEKNQKYCLLNDITIYPSNEAVSELSFYSNESSIVKVDSVGNLTALSYGEAIITIRASNITKSVHVIVLNDENTSTSNSNKIKFLTDRAVKIGVGLDFNPYAILNVTSNVTFSLSDYSKAKIDNNRIIGLIKGTVIVTATYNGESDSITLIIE